MSIEVSIDSMTSSNALEPGGMPFLRGRPPRDPLSHTAAIFLAVAAPPPRFPMLAKYSLSPEVIIIRTPSRHSQYQSRLGYQVKTKSRLADYRRRLTCLLDGA